VTVRIPSRIPLFPTVANAARDAASNWMGRKTKTSPTIPGRFKLEEMYKETSAGKTDASNVQMSIDLDRVRHGASGTGATIASIVVKMPSSFHVVEQLFGL
jgi:hypothetical protein